MRECIDAFNWADTALGPSSGWPVSLKTSINIMLQAPSPACVFWGDELILLYNDAMQALLEGTSFRLAHSLQTTHPSLAGEFLSQLAADTSARLAPDAWQGESLSAAAAATPWAGFAFSPLTDDAGRPRGVLALGFPSDRPLADHLSAMIRLHELIARLQSNIDLKSALQEVLMAAIDLTGADMGNVQLLDPDSNTLHIVAHAGIPAPFFDHFSIVTQDDNSASGRAFRDGRRIVIEDILADPLYAPHQRTARQSGYRAVQATPLVSHYGEILGMLSTLFHEPRRPSDRELRTLDLYAREAARFIERIRKEERLREDETRFRILVESMAQAVWEAEPDGSVSRDSASWRAYTGQSLDEYLDRGWSNAVHPDDRPLIETKWQKAVATGLKLDAEFRLRGPGGEWRWTHMLCAPVRDVDQHIRKWVGMNLDITERKQAEINLRESETRYRNLFSSIEEGFCVFEMLYDADDKPVDYRWLETNPAFQRQTGLTDAVGRTARELIPDFEQYRIDIYAQVAKTGVRQRFIEESPAMARWFEVEAFRIGTPEQRRVALLFADITERRKTDIALRRSEMRYRTLFESIDEGFCIVEVLFDSHDKPVDYRFLETNPSFVKQSGLINASGKTMRELSPQHEAFWFETYGGVALTGKPVRFTQHAEQLGRWFDVYAFRFGAPELRQVAILFKNINEHIQAEQALLEADRRKDEFLATLAHELRNPLAPLRSGVEVIRLAQENNMAVQQVLTVMDRQLHHLVHLIDDLLDVSRISRGKIELHKDTIELSRVVQNAVDTVMPLIRQADQQLDISQPAQPLHVFGDEVRLGQVLSNLLNNACKFTPRGGHIALSVDQQHGEILIAVRDNGVGIAEHLLAEVFELFIQGDTSLEKTHGGLGIGLTIVKRLIEMHGGRVTVHSKGPGTGSEFLIHLPAVDRPEQAAPPAAEPVLIADAGRRILIVDDNRDAAHSLKLLLEVLGHETRTAYDGLEALSAGALLKPDMILLDLGMPRMNGYEAAREIRRQPWGKDIILVALTGWGQDENRQRSHAAGFNVHLVKPVDTDAIVKLFTQLTAPGRAEN